MEEEMKKCLGNKVALKLKDSDCYMTGEITSTIWFGEHEIIEFVGKKSGLKYSFDTILIENIKLDPSSEKNQH